MDVGEKGDYGNIYNTCVVGTYHGLECSFMGEKDHLARVRKLANGYHSC
jgi:hypothetical protein